MSINELKALASKEAERRSARRKARAAIGGAMFRTLCTLSVIAIAGYALLTEVRWATHFVLLVVVVEGAIRVFAALLTLDVRNAASKLPEPVRPVDQSELLYRLRSADQQQNG